MTVFSLDSKMSEVESLFPFSRSMLHKKFHVGGCATCGYEPQESIADVAKKHGKNALEMVEALNEGLDSMNSTEITPAQLYSKTAENASILFIDVRESWEFEIVQFPNAILLSEANMESTVEKFSSFDLVIFYCHHGMRSLNATLYFKEFGHSNIKSLKGGIDQYAQLIDSTLPRY